MASPLRIPPEILKFFIYGFLQKLGIAAVNPLGIILGVINL